MEEKSLSVALSDSIKQEVVENIGSLVEIGLDSVMDEGLFKDIPLISTIVSVYKIGRGIKECHNIKKLIQFLYEINNGIVDEKKRTEYQKKFQSNEKFRNQEIEYLLVLIDRYISYEKPRILAKLYLAYLDEKINWIQFQKYASVIDQLLPEDICVLGITNFEKITSESQQIDSVLRLLAVGVVFQNAGIETEYDDGRLSLNDKRGYTLTEFGKILKNIII